MSLPRSGFAKDSVEVEGYVRGFARRRPDVMVTVLRFANFLGPGMFTPMSAYFELPVVPTVLGFDPLQVTLISVALTVVVLPIIVLPFLVLMNEQEYVKGHTNGPIGNALLVVLTILGAIMALVVIPLEVFGG